MEKNLKFRIMMVDDIQANLDFMKDILSAHGNYQVVGTNNGRAAISKAMAYPFDLILLDIIMPGIDGFKVCEKLKSLGFRCETDFDAQKINAKIREHSMQKIPYILAIGKREAEDGTVAVRRFGSQGQEVMSLDEFVTEAKRVKESRR